MNPYVKNRVGRPPAFESPEDLQKECAKYFKWAEENPLMEERPFAYKGDVIMDDVKKMRALTLMGLCLYVNISLDTWSNYRKRENFLGVITWAENIIFTQKFEGAAADLLNANIISRDLGLMDSQRIESHVEGDTNIVVKTKEEAASVKKLLDKFKDEE